MFPGEEVPEDLGLCDNSMLLMLKVWHFVPWEKRGMRPGQLKNERFHLFWDVKKRGIPQMFSTATLSEVRSE